MKTARDYAHRYHVFVNDKRGGRTSEEVTAFLESEFAEALAQQVPEPEPEPDKVDEDQHGKGRVLEVGGHWRYAQQMTLAEFCLFRDECRAEGREKGLQLAEIALQNIPEASGRIRQKFYEQLKATGQDGA